MKTPHALRPVVAALVVSICISPGRGQQTSTTIAPEESGENGRWEEIDQRLVFLMVRLANLEASFDAVRAAIGKTTGQRTAMPSLESRATPVGSALDDGCREITPT